MDARSRDRISFALTVLSTRIISQKLADSDIETLKAYFDGSQAGMSIYEIAAAVVSAELKRLAQVKSA
jgi:hypothetical protein